MQGHMISNAELRARARLEIRSNFQTLLLVTFIAVLPSLIAGTLRNLAIPDDALESLRSLYTAYSQSLSMTEEIQQILQRILTPLLENPNLVIAGVCTLLSILVTPMLTLGLNACMLRQLRGESFGASDVFCRKQLVFRAIGQLLWIVLLEILWMLPGLAVMLLGILCFSGSLILFEFTSMVGSLMMLVLGFRAALSYSQAQFVLADHPEMTIRQSVRQSIAMMGTRRMSYAMLYVSLLFWTILQWGIEDLLSGVSPVIATIVGLAISLVLSLYMSMSFASFYLRESAGRLPPEHSASEKSI